MSALLKDYIKELLVPLTLALLSGIIGYFKGKKESVEAISRKEKIYLPMINELDEVSRKLDLFKQVNLPVVLDIVENNYKYVVDDTTIKKLQLLDDLIIMYNDINVVRIAHEILVDHFQKCFESLYGSVIEGYSHHVDQFGNEYEIPEEVEEFKAIKGLELQKEIKSLISHESMPDYLIQLNDSDYYDDMYSDIVRVYELSFNLLINGKLIPKRKTPPNWSGTIHEYFAYTCNFFEEFNNNSDVVKKLELRDKIAEMAQCIVQELKELVKDIVYKYEKEVV